MKNFALRTAVIYFIVGTGWILGSDQLLDAIVPSESRLMIGSMKGVLFVFVTSIALFLILREYIKRLRNNELQYRALFTTHPQPIWIYDIKTLQFLAANNATLKKYGYSREEFLNMTMLEIRPESERAAIENFLLNVQKADYIADVVHLHKAKDGRTFYTRTSSHATEFDGKAARMVMAVDAQAEKEAEHKMNISETKMNSLLNNSADIIWMYDETGAIITYNDSFKKKFEQILNVRVPTELPFRLDPMADDPIISRWVENLKLAMAGKQLRIEEGFLNHHTGDMEYFEIIMTPIYDDRKNLIGVGSIARDITQRLIAQKEIENRISQLKEIAWIQSHTVRRPLANIMGLVELIKMNSGDRKQIDEAVDLLEKSCNELDEIIREVVKKAGNLK